MTVKAEQRRDNEQYGLPAHITGDEFATLPAELQRQYARSVRGTLDRNGIFSLKSGHEERGNTGGTWKTRKAVKK